MCARFCETFAASPPTSIVTSRMKDVSVRMRFFGVLRK